MDSYRVIKDIPNVWQVGAKAGDVLTIRLFGGDPTLTKDGKAVWELGSTFEKRHCEKIIEKNL